MWRFFDPKFGKDALHRAHLPRATVDQEEIGPGVGLAVRDPLSGGA